MLEHDETLPANEALAIDGSLGLLNCASISGRHLLAEQNKAQPAAATYTVKEMLEASRFS